MNGMKSDLDTLKTIHAVSVVSKAAIEYAGNFHDYVMSPPQ